MLPNLYFCSSYCKIFVGFSKHAIGSDGDFLKNSFTRATKMDKNDQISSCADAKCGRMLKEPDEPTCDTRNYKTV